MKSKDNKESKIRRCVKAPIRALSRARDFYVRSMNNLAGDTSFGGGYPSAQAPTLNKSFSVNASLSTRSDEDFRELLRVASTRSLSNKIESSEFVPRQQSTRGRALKVVPRSESVGFGRIDEDHTCDFGDEDIKFKTTANHLFPRSKSYAVTKY